MWIMVLGIILLNVASAILTPSWFALGIIVFGLGFVMAILGIIGCIWSMVKGTKNMIVWGKVDDLTPAKKLLAIFLIIVGIAGTVYSIVQIIILMTELPQLLH